MNNEIAEIREIRHRISAECGHDIYKVAEYYREVEELKQMNTATTHPEPRLKAFRVTEDEIIASLIDGRTISVPLVWSWRLSEASPEQRNRFEILGDGEGIHWPELDGVVGILSGMPALPPAAQDRVSVDGQ